MKYEVEVENTAKIFRFRLLASDGRCTPWCSYTQVAMIDNICTATQFYLPANRALTPISPEELLRSFAVVPE